VTKVYGYERTGRRTLTMDEVLEYRLEDARKLLNLVSVTDLRNFLATRKVPDRSKWKTKGEVIMKMKLRRVLDGYYERLPIQPTKVYVPARKLLATRKEGETIEETRERIVRDAEKRPTVYLEYKGNPVMLLVTYTIDAPAKEGENKEATIHEIVTSKHTHFVAIYSHGALSSMTYGKPIWVSITPDTLKTFNDYMDAVRWLANEYKRGRKTLKVKSRTKNIAQDQAALREVKIRGHFDIKFKKR
jgi:hypothetical protein